jgi:DNA topoisomerase IB
VCRRAEPAAAERGRRPAARLPVRLTLARRHRRGHHDYLGEISGGDYTAKDFRTWHATVLAAVGLAVSEGAAGSEGARKGAIARVVQEVAGYLGNTPAVARASYIDPRVIDLYQDGRTIVSALGELGKDSDFGDLATRGRAEKAVLNLLASA